MTHDRTYWRAKDDRSLAEAARDSGHELCIALGERLDDYRNDYRDIDDQLDELRAQHADMSARCERFRLELIAYETAIYGGDE